MFRFVFLLLVGNIGIKDMHKTAVDSKVAAKGKPKIFFDNHVRKGKNRMQPQQQQVKHEVDYSLQ